MAKKPAKPVPRDADVAADNMDTGPATNLLIADIAMRSGTTLMRYFVERSLLKGRYGAENAKQIVEGRSLKHTLASVIVAKIATRSVPGALVIGGGLLAKGLLDRGGKRRKARRLAQSKNAHANTRGPQPETGDHPPADRPDTM